MPESSKAGTRARTATAAMLAALAATAAVLAGCSTPPADPASASEPSASPTASAKDGSGKSAGHSSPGKSAKHSTSAKPAKHPTITDPTEAKKYTKKVMKDKYGWGAGQFKYVEWLWDRESSWKYSASNGSGAYGIPQALPASKMASAGSDYETNAATQIDWGLQYIKERYGSPGAAWAHSQQTGAY